mmetsp:Transcript_16634/g.25654  ORF Transcript_16634/g.25654 Transcript_16634/m.25654 type:complete len:204 (-) Transcript_16634:425-1036(-)
MSLGHSNLRRVETAGCSILTGDTAFVTGFSTLIHVSPSGVHRGVHIRDLALHQLKVTDGLAKLFALHHVRHDFVQTGRNDTGADACQNHTFVIQTGHENRDTFAFFTEDILKWHLNIFEDQFGGVGTAHAKLVKVRRGGKSLHLFFDQEGGDATRASIRISFGIDHKCVGVRPVGDPVFVAVQHKAIVSLLRPQLHRHHVGAC